VRAYLVMLICPGLCQQDLHSERGKYGYVVHCFENSQNCSIIW
jgi:hypothetical protein